MHLLILLPFLVAGGVLFLRETAPAVLERRRALKDRGRCFSVLWRDGG